MTVSGIILQNNSYIYVFYFYGTVGFLCFLLNCAFCYNKPIENPFISDEEIKYLSENMSKHFFIVKLLYTIVLLVQNVIYIFREYSGRIATNSLGPHPTLEAHLGLGSVIGRIRLGHVNFGNLHA